MTSQCSRIAILVILILLISNSGLCETDDISTSRLEVMKVDLRGSPEIWNESLKNIVKPSNLLLLSGSAVAALVASEYKDEITEEIQRHENYEDISSIGDDYGSAVNSVLPQFAIYLLGVGIKSDKVREFGILTTHAAILADVLTQALKIITNSDRPDGSSSSRVRFKLSFWTCLRNRSSCRADPSPLWYAKSNAISFGEYLCWH